MTDAGLSLDSVSIDFDGVTALEDVSIDVEQGEFFTLVGPSGCGKTTTLRAIAGLETPSKGTVSIGDVDVGTLPPEQRNVGVVFQNYALFPHMSVRENVGYGLRFHDPPEGVDEAERVEELLELVDMAGLGDREPSQLSGGQRQRIALARALAPNPDVLLLDEPLSALDASLRERLRVTVREIQQSLGITTVYVTHDQTEALAISDRVAVLSDGHIEQIGEPQTIYRKPATRFVAEFVGDNNVFEAVVQDTDPLRVAIEGQQITVDGTKPMASGDTLALSVRPEHICFGAGDVTIPATVAHVEFLGDAYRVHCEWNGAEVLVKTPHDGVPSGEVTLGFDVGDLRIV